MPSQYTYNFPRIYAEAASSNSVTTSDKATDKGGSTGTFWLVFAHIHNLPPAPIDVINFSQVKGLFYSEEAAYKHLEHLIRHEVIPVTSQHGGESPRRWKDAGEFLEAIEIGEIRDGLSEVMGCYRVGYKFVGQFGAQQFYWVEQHGDKLETESFTERVLRMISQKERGELPEDDPFHMAGGPFAIEPESMDDALEVSYEEGKSDWEDDLSSQLTMSGLSSSVVMTPEVSDDEERSDWEDDASSQLIMSGVSSSVVMTPEVSAEEDRSDWESVFGQDI